MERPNTIGIIAILGLVTAASMNLMLYDISTKYAILFFLIPISLGSYGVISRSRAFILSGAASLLLVSLRPDTGESYLIIPFLVGFLTFIETAEASIRLHNDRDDVAKKNYITKGSIIVSATLLFALGVYYLAPRLTALMGKASGSAAILDTIQLPLIVGLVLLASLAVGSLALKH